MMKAILIIELEDDVNLNDVEIRYVIQDRYGMPVKAEVDGYPLKPLPSRKNNDESVMVGSLQMDIGYILGWNECLEEIEK